MEEEETFAIRTNSTYNYRNLTWTKTQIVEALQDYSNWLFVDGQMVDAGAVREMDLSQAVQPFTLTAALIHPPDCPCLNRRKVQTYRDGDYQTEEIPTTNIFGDSWTVFVNGCRSSSIEYQDTEIPSDARIKRLPNIRPRRNRFKTKR